uniref:Reverse transcriptase n=1 Tax=Plectus sambesii TaxID=2011161 RepID=A0A914X9M3_9BILA
MMEDVAKIDLSLLAPWQKFDVTYFFVLSRLSFHLKPGVVPKRPLTELDKKNKAVDKKWLYLPQRASAEPLYLPYRHGGMNLLPLSLLADIAQMVHALRLLTSNDPSTWQLSLNTLNTVVKKKIRREVEEEDVSEYLNGSTSGVFCVKTSDTTSMWTHLRSATRRLRSKINVCWQHSEGSVSLLLDGAMVSRTQVESQLHDAVRAHYLHRLLAKPDQGKVFKVTAETSAANHFMRAGNFTRFAEWRFIHRARLGVVPLNGCRRFGMGDKRCRRCGQADETLPHVLNHCRQHFPTMTRRHNAILDRLVKAMKMPPWTTIHCNQRELGQTHLQNQEVRLAPHQWQEPHCPLNTLHHPGRVNDSTHHRQLLRTRPTAPPRHHSWNSHMGWAMVQRGKAIICNADRVGLKAAKRKVRPIRHWIQRILGLSLLPVHLVKSIWTDVLRHPPQDRGCGEYLPAMRHFVKSFEKIWLVDNVRINLWNHYDNEGCRTTNAVEGYHSMI